jgi:hypothetical protein
MNKYDQSLLKNINMKYNGLLIISPIIVLFSAIPCLPFSQAGSGPVISAYTTNQPETIKYGALAIERDNGYYFGLAFDCTTLEEAQKKAVEECTKRRQMQRGVVFSGTCCGPTAPARGKMSVSLSGGVWLRQRKKLT